MCTVTLTADQIDRILDSLPVRTHADIIVELVRARGEVSIGEYGSLYSHPAPMVATIIGRKKEAPPTPPTRSNCGTFGSPPFTEPGDKF